MTSGQLPAISTVARNIRVAQAAAMLSNTDLASRVGVNPRTIGRWRRGDMEITVGALERVALALGREVTWFLTDHEPVESAA
jgi:transcriptional regulator with XRE-family HTH domain